MLVKGTMGFLNRYDRERVFWGRGLKGTRSRGRRGGKRPEEELVEVPDTDLRRLQALATDLELLEGLKKSRNEELVEAPDTDLRQLQALATGLQLVEGLNNHQKVLLPIATKLVAEMNYPTRRAEVHSFLQRFKRQSKQQYNVLINLMRWLQKAQRHELPLAKKVLGYLNNPGQRPHVLKFLHQLQRKDGLRHKVIMDLVGQLYERRILRRLVHLKKQRQETKYKEFMNGLRSRRGTKYYNHIRNLVNQIRYSKNTVRRRKTRGNAPTRAPTTRPPTRAPIPRVMKPAEAAEYILNVDIMSNNTASVAGVILNQKAPASCVSLSFTSSLQLVHMSHLRTLFTCVFPRGLDMT